MIQILILIVLASISSYSFTTSAYANPYITCEQLDSIKVCQESKENIYQITSPQWGCSTFTSVKEILNAPEFETDKLFFEKARFGECWFFPLNKSIHKIHLLTKINNVTIVK